MKDITIVSAFIAIGRENYSTFARSNQKYVDYFKRWARIKNDLIFFCESEELKQIVLDIRKQYGLEEKTRVVVIDDVFSVEKEIYAKMEEIEHSEHFQKFRGNVKTPENIAKYNYVMLMKYYFTFKASQMIEKDTQIAWVDFGFEHGGGTFADENDYAFLWEYDFGDKVNLFRLEYEEKRPIFEVCRTIHPDSMMGCLLIIPKNLAEKYWLDIRECMKSLVNVGLMDDDQLLLLMSQREHPDYVKATVSDWFLPIAQYGGEHFKILPKQKRTFFQKVVGKIKKILKISK